jgi:hypothetical protein
MKNTLNLLLLFTAIVAFNDASAQNAFGFKGGLQMSHMSGFEGNPQGYLSSLQLKVILLPELSEQVFLTPSFGYSGKGFRWNNLELTDQYGNSLGQGDVVGLFNYLQLSLPVTYRFAAPKNNQFYIGAGPYFSYALSGKGKFKNAAVPNAEDSWDLYEGNNYKKMDGGIVIDFASRLKNNFLIAANVDIGLININNGAGNKLKNMAAGLSVGYLFTGKSK